MKENEKEFLIHTYNLLRPVRTVAEHEYRFHEVLSKIGERIKELD